MVINVSILLLTLEMETYLHVLRTQNQQKSISKWGVWGFFSHQNAKFSALGLKLPSAKSWEKCFRPHCASFNSVTGLDGFALLMPKVKP